MTTRESDRHRFSEIRDTRNLGTTETPLRSSLELLAHGQLDTEVVSQMIQTRSTTADGGVQPHERRFDE
ncbi:MAG: hypothetical protein ABEI99_01315 [Halobaculum sp.]